MLNIAGHRLGTAELENAFRAHPAVAEAAVVGVPDKIKGEAAKAFIILNPGFTGSDELMVELQKHMRKELGPVAAIKSVEFRESLPRTKSGKILRRVLKRGHGRARRRPLHAGRGRQLIEVHFMTEVAHAFFTITQRWRAYLRMRGSQNVHSYNNPFVGKR